MKFLHEIVILIISTTCYGFEVFRTQVHFEADVRTGVISSTQNGVASVFTIRCLLLIETQKHDDYANIIYKFIDTQIFNGNGHMPREGPITTFGDELIFYDFSNNDTTSHFEKPFLIITKNGVLEKFSSETSDEPKWIRNFKRNIVTIYQSHGVNNSWILAESDLGVVHSEKTIYGNCQMQSYVKNYPESGDYIFKTNFDAKTCTDYKILDISSVEKSHCASKMPNDNQLSHSAERSYYFSAKSDYMLNKINSISRVFYYPFRSGGEQFYSVVNQTFLHDSWDQVDVDYAQSIDSFVYKWSLILDGVNSEREIIESVAYNFYPFLPDTLGTRTEICVNGIKEIASTSSTLGETGYLTYSLAYFTPGDLQDCYDLLIVTKNENHIKIFYNLISSIGTRDSLLFLRNAIIESKIQDSVASSLLQNLPFTVVLPRQEILDDWKEFIRDDSSLKPIVKRSAVLAYATLAYLTFKNVKDQSGVQDYVNYFADQLENAQNYSDQLLWLSGLRNIELGRVFALLKTIIGGEFNFSFNKNYDELREQALWGLQRYVHDNQNEVNDIVWPLIIDSRVSLRHRIPALKVYVNGISSTAQIDLLFNALQFEECHHFYRYFITLIKSYQKSTNNCGDFIGYFAKSLEKYEKNYDSDVGTKFYLYTEYNEAIESGGQVSGTLIADNITNNLKSLSFNYETYVGGNKFESRSFYVKFGNGLSNGMNYVEDYLLNRPFDLLKLKKVLNEDIDLEFAIFINGRIVCVNHIGESNTIANFDFFSNLFAMSTSIDFSFRKIYNSQIIINSEVGVPLTKSYHHPVATKFMSDISYDLNGRLSVALYFVQNVNGHYGLKLFNHFSQTWTGVAHNYNYNTQIPLIIDLDFSSNSSIHLEFDYSKYLDKYFSFETSSITQSFVEHISDSEFAYNTTSSPRTVAAHVDETLFDEVYYDYIGLTIATQTNQPDQIDLTNHDRGYTNGLYNIFANDFYKVPVTFRSLLLNYLLVPNKMYLKNGIYIYQRTDDDLDKVSKLVFDIAFDIEHDYPKDTYWIPKITFDTKINITTIHKIPEKNVLWEINMEWITDKGDFLNTFTVDAFRKWNYFPYHFDTFCVRRNKTVDSKRASGNFKVYSGKNDKKICCDDYHVTIAWTGEKSSEQISYDLNNHFTYKSCQKQSYYSKTSQSLNFNCIYDLTSLRNYKYAVTYKLPDHVEEKLTEIYSQFLSSHIESVWHEENGFDEGFTVNVVYKIHSDQGYSNVAIKFPHHTEYLKLFYYGNFPVDYDSTAISRGFNSFQKLNLISKCHVQLMITESFNISESSHVLAISQANKWTTLLAPHQSYTDDSSHDFSYGLYAKQSKYGLQFKFKLHNNFVIIDVDPDEFVESDDDSIKYRIIFDPKFYNSHTSESLFETQNKLKSSILSYRDFFVIAVPQYAFYAVYDRENIVVEYFGDSKRYYGECLGPFLENLKN